MIFNPGPPGEVLKDYLGGMTVREAAARLRMTRATLSRIINFTWAPSRRRAKASAIRRRRSALAEVAGDGA